MSEEEPIISSSTDDVLQLSTSSGRYESQPILSKEERLKELDTRSIASYEDSYGTFYVGPIPKTLTLRQKKHILKKQRQQAWERQFGSRDIDKMYAKFTKSIEKSTKTVRDIHHDYFRIWDSSMRQIEGRLGFRVSAYFKVLVWLLKINVLCMILGLAFIVGPGAYMANHRADDHVYNKDDLKCTNPNFVNGTDRAVNSVLQLFAGTGWMESTAMFYGWYPTGNFTSNIKGEERTTYYFSLAYFTVGISYFLISFLFMLYNLSHQFRKPHPEQLERKPYSSKLLTWDYGIKDVEASQQLSMTLVKSLKLKAAEDARDAEGVKWEFLEKMEILFLRLVTNGICMVVPIAIMYWCLNRILTDSNRSEPDSTDSCGELKENSKSPEQLATFWSTYSASILVALSNVILPALFELIGKFEMYEHQSTRITITRFRMVIAKLFVISAYLVCLYIAVLPSGGQAEVWQTPDNSLFYNCWEDFVASQVYQLALVDFIVFCITLLLTEVLRNCMITKITFLRDTVCMTKAEFKIGTETLDLVHKQMIFWSGFYFSPLLPVFAVVEIVVIFYVRKASALKNVLPPRTVVFNYQSTVVKNFILLIALLHVFGFMGHCIFNLKPSAGCGPFRGEDSFSDPFTRVIDQSGPFNKYIVRKVKSTPVLITLVVLIGLLLYYYLSLAASRKVAIELLRKQVKHDIAGRKYLQEQLNDSRAKAEEERTE